MLARRTFFLASLALAIVLGALPASAAEWKPFTQAEFTAAKKDGKPILVDIFAAWCPICRAQNPILTQLTREPEFKDLVVFKVDFDTQKAEVRALGATQQSTLIAFKGEKETARSVGDTNPASLADLVRSAL